MTKHTETAQPLSAQDFTLALFCRVDDELKEAKKPALARLHRSEVVTVGVLQVLRGQGWRAFYRWLSKELKSLFPHLPEQSRLFRLWRKYQHLGKRFLAQPTALGVCDTFGIELMHPRREGRCEWHMDRKGKSNGRCIVGAKWFVLINQQGLIVRIGCCSANCHATLFGCVIESFEEKMIVLADKGFHAQQGDPMNLKICEKGQWNERMLIETLFSACEGVFNMKKMDYRLKHSLQTRLHYTAAALNLCMNWTGKVRFNFADFKL
ncbi:transposase [bacterium]|nr:MAG: transposase [bacterium]